MSLIRWFQNFFESCARKQSAKAQIIAHASRPGMMVETRDDWSSPLRVETLDPGTEMDPFVNLLAGGSREGASRGGAQLLEALPEVEAPIRYLADVPRELREQIQQDGMARTFRHLETSLRALHMATSRKGISYPADELHGFLLMWRQALSEYVGLTPDERSVMVYDRSVDEAYFVRGRCEVGAHLTVIEPCWMLQGEVVVRGEAQVVQGWVR